MFEHATSESPWPALIAWWVLYTADYVLTIWSARLYDAHGRKHISFEGSFELNPVHQRAVDARRWMSPRFLALLMYYSMVIFLTWLLSVPSGTQRFFHLVIGALLLPEVAILMRHAHNLSMFLGVRLDPSAVYGHVSYARRHTLRLSSIEFLAFAALFLLLWAAVGGLMFLGGSAACFAYALQHWRLSNRRSLQPVPAPEAVVPSTDEEDFWAHG